MNLESVSQKLESEGVNIITSEHEMYWDNESIVVEFGDTHVLIYVTEDNLTYYLLDKSYDEDEEEDIFHTSHLGDSPSVEDMISDLGIN